MKNRLIVIIATAALFSAFYWLGCGTGTSSSTAELDNGVGSSPGGGGEVVSRSENKHPPAKRGVLRLLAPHAIV